MFPCPVMCLKKDIEKIFEITYSTVCGLGSIVVLNCWYRNLLDLEDAVGLAVPITPPPYFKMANFLGIYKVVAKKMLKITGLQLALPMYTRKIKVFKI